jgi:hypothetical protein
MKEKLFLILILISFYCTAQNLEWKSTFCNQINDSIETIAYHEGYIYYGGIFKGTVDFDPSANVLNLTSNNSFLDIYFCKSDSAGNFIWAKQISIYTNSQFGNNTYLNSINIKVDGNGNIYAAGQFVDTLDIDPGAAVNYLLPSSGGNFYIAKFDPNGNLIWAKQTSSNNNLNLHDFELDNDGDLYTVGSFNDTVDFDLGPGLFQLNSLSSLYEGFVCKYTIDGILMNAKNFPTSFFSSINSIAIDSEKNLLLCGYFQDSIEFDSGVVVYQPRSVFLCKLDSLFSYQWEIHSSNNGLYNFPFPAGLCLDAFDNVYFSCTVFSDNIQFNSGADSLVPEAVLPFFYRTFIVKSDAGGNLKWAKTFGNQYHSGDKITPLINTDGLLYINGRYEANSDFDPGPDSTILIGNKMYSFIEVLDTAGNFLDVDVIGNGTGNWVNLNEIVNDENGNLYLIGDYRNLSASSIDCDPGIGISNLPNTNFVFLLKWGLGNYTSISKDELGKGIYIFPNPMTLSATVVLKQNVNHAIAKIYNSMGQLVNEISYISGDSFSLSRENLKAGFYFIKLIENNKIIATEKFMLSDF